CLRVVRLDIDKASGQYPVAIPLADQVDLGHLAGAELQTEPVHVRVEKRREQPAVGAFGVWQPAKRAEADVHDERAPGNAVDDGGDRLHQVLRGPVLSGGRGGERLLDLDVVAAGGDELLDVSADGGNQGVRAFAAGAGEPGENERGFGGGRARDGH